MAEYKRLDTGVFNEFIENQNSILKEYDSIKQEYDAIVKDLTAVWKGRGADAFAEDARTVKANIVGIGDILQTMCDMLIDCRDVFDECDGAIGTANRNAGKRQN